ncbi:MAG: SBBP repeat-containing protein [Bryobacterales bacterium]|nr:SBBP repeat-containing protein [Bryobacterales bacterium]
MPPRARRLPLFFVPHVVEESGQAGYLLRTPDMAAFFSPDGAVFEAGQRRVSMRFAGARGQRAIEPAGPLPGKLNYLAGGRPENWRTGVATYGAILYRELYPGIDLLYEAGAEGLKSTFQVRAGADPSAIRWRYDGAGKPRVERDGRLSVAMGGGVLTEHKPSLYQTPPGGGTKPVEGGYRVFPDGSVGFHVEGYDRAAELVIDPVLSYSTYLGGTGLDWARAIAVDDSGNAYIAGYTDSSDFPLAGPYQAGRRGGVDAFVAKLDPTGTTLLYCTYLGGSGDDRAFGVAVDREGKAYVTGWTYSSNFPTTSGARQRSLGGGRDAFVAKLNSAGSALEYSTLLGGSGYDSGNAIAIDVYGQAHVAGETASANFPVLNGYRSAFGGLRDAFVAKLNASGSGLVWSTYLGGSSEDAATAIALDGVGNVYVTGGTTSANFPTCQPLQASNAGGQDAFVTKLASTGSALLFSTYLGGGGGTLAAGETGTGIAVDPEGNVYVTGYTSSSNFPTVNAYKAFHAGGTLDAFLAKLNAGGTALAYSTYFGGSGADYANAIAVSPSGQAAVGGYTSSSNLPVKDAVQAAKAGSYDGFVARFSPAGNALEFATYFGGGQSDTVSALAMNPGGNLWIAGQTLSADLPLKQPLQSSIAGGYTAFVAMLGQTAPTAVFRSAPYGNTILTTYGSAGLSNAYGTIASAPAISQSSSGDTIVAGRTAAGCVYLNRYKPETRAWDPAWTLAGCSLDGDPAVAAEPGGGAWVAARDSSYRYWINRYVPGTGFGVWTNLAGDFATDPVIARANNGAVYIVGLTGTGRIVSGRYLPAGGFQGWIPDPSAPAAAGKPAITIGADGAAYVSVRSQVNNIWMARLQGDVWGTWHNGGGQAKTDPEVAATGGVIHAVVTNFYDQVYTQAFVEGAGNGWQGWQFLNGILVKASIAASGGRYFIAGKNGAGTMYWYQSGVGWTYLGYAGLAASELAASPK